MQEKLEVSEQNLNQLTRKAEILPKVEEELQQKVSALTEVKHFLLMVIPKDFLSEFCWHSCAVLLQAEEKHGTAAERIQKLESLIEQLQGEVSRVSDMECSYHMARKITLYISHLRVSVFSLVTFPPFFL